MSPWSDLGPVRYNIKTWASYQSYIDGGWSHKEILRVSPLSRYYWEPRWGCWHPSRFYKIIRRIAYSRYISPDEIMAVGERYCKKWNYDWGLISDHGFRNSNWLSKGAPSKTGECIICTKAFYEEIEKRNFRFQDTLRDGDLRAERRRRWEFNHPDIPMARGYFMHSPEPDKFVCERKFCRDMWGWYCHTAHHRSPDYVNQKNLGIWIMSRFILHLTAHKRIRRKYYVRRKEIRERERRGRTGTNETNEFWFKECSIR